MIQSDILNPTILLLGIIILISVSECIGQSCLRNFYEHPSRIYLLLLGLLFYGMVCLLLVLSYKYRGMGIVNVLWSGISVLVVVSAGMVFFDEKITQMDTIGIALILTGIGFVLWEGLH